MSLITERLLDIKFRVWQKIQKRYIYQTLFEILNGVGNDCPDWETSEFDYLVCHCGAILERYTGLLDWWEGDLLLIPDTWTERICDDGTGPAEDFNHIAPIIKKDGSFGVDIQESGDWYRKGFICFYELFDNITIEEIKKIGNVHDNPKLMEDKK